jgi:hypothetical protein
MALFNRIHLTLWFKYFMVQAYLAYHRGEMVLCAEYENEANRYESELQRLTFLEQFK